MLTMHHPKPSQLAQQHFMVDGIECLAQVNKNRTSQPALVNVSADCISKAHSGPLSGMTLSETALIRAKNYTKINSFMPVLTIGIVRDRFYLLIFYSEKFST